MRRMKTKHEKKLTSRSSDGNTVCEITNRSILIWPVLSIMSYFDAKHAYYILTCHNVPVKITQPYICIDQHRAPSRAQERNNPNTTRVPHKKDNSTFFFGLSSDVALFSNHCRKCWIGITDKGTSNRNQCNRNVFRWHFFVLCRQQTNSTPTLYCTVPSTTWFAT